MKASFSFLSLLLTLSLISFGFALEQHHYPMFDKTRERDIPVEIYEGETQCHFPVVIINHGYGAKNTEYSFIANALAEDGYHVVSIQHDLESDASLPRMGNLYEQRKPFWERGVKNILFVMRELKKQKPTLNFERIILIGHSNGGDIAMMFARRYPKRVSKIVSLDSLRYPFPTNKEIPILRFGAIDTKPDDGVVPPHVETIFIKGAKHIDLCDRGNADIRGGILKSMNVFLKEDR